MSKFEPTVVEALKGHTSQETAFVVKDYPYGFRLRCQIRYWLEYKKGKGFRFWSQTSNPKAEAGNGTPAGTVWNKPKASTYIENGAFMYLDQNGHVEWLGLGIYNTAAEAREFLEFYREFINPEWLPVLVQWVERKEAYEKKKAELVAAEGPKPGMTQEHVAAVHAVQTVKFDVNYGGGRVEQIEVKK